MVSCSVVEVDVAVEVEAASVASLGGAMKSDDDDGDGDDEDDEKDLWEEEEYQQEEVEEGVKAATTPVLLTTGPVVEEGPDQRRRRVRKRAVAVVQLRLLLVLLVLLLLLPEVVPGCRSTRMPVLLLLLQVRRPRRRTKWVAMVGAPLAGDAGSKTTADRSLLVGRWSLVLLRQLLLRLGDSDDPGGRARQGRARQGRECWLLLQRRTTLTVYLWCQIQQARLVQSFASRRLTTRYWYMRNKVGSVAHEGSVGDVGRGNKRMHVRNARSC